MSGNKSSTSGHHILTRSILEVIFRFVSRSGKLIMKMFTVMSSCTLKTQIHQVTFGVCKYNNDTVHKNVPLSLFQYSTTAGASSLRLKQCLRERQSISRQNRKTIISQMTNKTEKKKRKIIRYICVVYFFIFTACLV